MRCEEDRQDEAARQGTAYCCYYGRNYGCNLRRLELQVEWTWFVTSSNLRFHLGLSVFPKKPLSRREV